MNERTNFNLKQWLQSPTGLVWIAISITALFLIKEYAAYIINVLPYLFVLLCPLLHIFMHSGHANHDEEKRKNHSEQQANQSEKPCH